MNELDHKIHTLYQRLEILQRRQSEFHQEIQTLKQEIDVLRQQTKSESGIIQSILNEVPDSTSIIQEPDNTPLTPTNAKPIEEKTAFEIPRPNAHQTHRRSDWEKFVGENLINKIGIFISILGVAIGTKYSIDNNLISPLTRIILGYIGSTALLLVGIRIRLKYINYSAVLVSGALAMLFIITFFSYSLYHFIPHLVAFGMMAIISGFTVYAAIQYNRQVIAHFGLVGSYLIPFLLNNGSENYVMLFAYITLINFAILLLAIRKDWWPLYTNAFSFTWLITLIWYVANYREEHFWIGLIYSTLFYLVFFAIILYRAQHTEKVKSFFILIFLFLNTLIYYNLFYSLLSRNTIGTEYLGLFTLLLAATNIVASRKVTSGAQQNSVIHYMLSGIGLILVTLVFPVQFDGNWVTIFWACEATLLLWIGRSKAVPFFEKISYFLFLIATFSLVGDWGNFYGRYDNASTETYITPFLNIQFLTSLIVLVSFALACYILHTRRFQSPSQKDQLIYQFTYYGLPFILLSLGYQSVFHEINNYWDQCYSDSCRMMDMDTTTSWQSCNPNYTVYNKWSVMIYSLLFIIFLIELNIRKIKSSVLGQFNLIVSAAGILSFIVFGLPIVDELQSYYLHAENYAYFHSSSVNLWLRYPLLFVAAILFVFIKRQLKAMEYNKILQIVYDCVLHITLLIVVCNEVPYWMELNGITESDRPIGSILCGIYSLVLSGYGIWRKQQHLRILAFATLFITLIYLCFYRFATLSMLQKTAVCVSLGAFLLIISYLYNRYKHLIQDEKTD
jgi:hypothetical protein